MEEIFLPVTVFFDSDVMIAGSASTTGASFALLQFAELGLIHGTISDQVVEECRTNLARKLPEAVTPFEKIVERCVTVTSIPTQASLSRAANQAFEKDIGILASALDAGVRFLVTFNVKDYWPSEKTLEVVTPVALLFRIREALAGQAEG